MNMSKNLFKQASLASAVIVASTGAILSAATAFAIPTDQGAPAVVQASDACTFYGRFSGAYSFGPKPGFVTTGLNKVSVALGPVTGLSPATGGGNITGGTQFTTEGSSSAFKSIQGGLFEAAIGYNITPSFAADVGVIFTTGMVAKSNTASTSSGDSFSTNSWGMLVNGYYYFNETSALRPYVTAGVGFESMSGKLKLTDSGVNGAYLLKTATTNVGTPDGATLAFPTAAVAGSSNTVVIDSSAKPATIKSKTSANFAAQAGLGVSYNFTQGMSMYLGYNLRTVGRATWKDPTGSVMTVNSVPSYSVAQTNKTKSGVRNNVTLGLKMNF